MRYITTLLNVCQGAVWVGGSTFLLVNLGGHMGGLFEGAIFAHGKFGNQPILADFRNFPWAKIA